MDAIFQILISAQQASQYALDQTGRYNAPIRAIVTNNVDPEKRRRVRVSDPACPGLETYWIRPVRSESYIDCVLPDVGATVICWFVDGNPIDGYYLPVQNDTNPPFDKADPIKDRWQNVPGISRSDVGKDRLDNTSNNHVETVGNDATLDVKRNVLETIAGTFTQQVKKAIDIFSNLSIILRLANLAKFELKETGEISARTPIGSGFTFSPDGQLTLFVTNINILPPVGSSGTSTPINLGGRTMQLNNGSLLMTNMTNVRINTKDVATVGAIDSDSDVIQQKGWS